MRLQLFEPIFEHDPQRPLLESNLSPDAMTKVDFYTGSADKLHSACQLSQRALQNNLRVFVHTPSENLAQQLDKMLWHIPHTSFMPHCFSQDAEAVTAPIVLGWDENFPHSDLLISLDLQVLPFFSRFDRLIEIVGATEEEVALGRERYTFYRERGYEIRHIDLRASTHA